MKREPIPTFKKQMVYANCNGKCKICGKQIKFKKATVDHIIPVSQGGTDDVKNLQIACKKCNTFKSNLDSWRFVKRSFKMFLQAAKSYIP